jgi:hypothetical protein
MNLRKITIEELTKLSKNELIGLVLNLRFKLFLSEEEQ